MRRARHFLLGLAAFLAFLAAALSAAFLLAQTSFGKVWIAREAGRLWSRPGFSVAIEGLGGTIPFRMTAKGIAIGDAEGTWLRLSGVAIDLSAPALLLGRGRIRLLAAREVRVARLPSSGGKPASLRRLALPVLPVAFRLDRLEVARLVLAPPVLGERVNATLSGRAAVSGRTAHAALDLHRTDGVPGGLTLSLALSHSLFSVHLRAEEPTGILIDRLFSREDHPPFALSLDGAGPVENWRGRVSASAGSIAHLSAHLNLSLAARTDLSLKGTASLARLLPPAIAPLLGERVEFGLAARLGSGIAIDRLAIDWGSGRITGKGSYRSRRQKLRAEIAALVPNLAPFGRLVGLPMAGTARLQGKLIGTLSRPRLTANLGVRALSLAGAGAQMVSLRLEAKPESAEAKRRFAIRAEGQIRGISLSRGKTLPPELSGPVTFSLSALATGEGKTVRLTRFVASGPGGELAGSGRVFGEGRLLEARLRFSAPDLAMFSALARRPLGGAVLLEAQAERGRGGGLSITLEGKGRAVKTGVAEVDALLGGRLGFVGSAERTPTGALRFDHLTIAAADADISASGELDPSSRLRASLLFSVPRLGPLGAALGVPLEGALGGRARLEGPLDRIALESEWKGSALALGRVRVDTLALGAKVADLSRPVAAIGGGWSARGLDGKLALVLKPLPGDRLELGELRLTAPGSTVAGNLKLALATGLLQGKIEGKIADLKPWSPLLGLPLEGGLAWRAEFAPGRGEEVRLSAKGERLRAGSWSLGRLSLAAEFADLFAAPRGKGRLRLAALRSPRADFSALSLSVASVRAGDFALEGEVKGRPASVSLSGRLTLAQGREELRLTRLDGALGSERLRLLSPVALTRRGADFALSGLDLRLGSGRIGGSGAVRGDLLSLRLKAQDLPIAPLAGLAGYASLAGAASLDAALGGTLAAPRGHAVLRMSGLGAGLSGRRLPSLGLRLEGDWDGQKIDFAGRLEGLEGDRIGLEGSLPLLLARAPLSFSLPPQGLLRLEVKGAGDLAHVEGFLPLGEERLSGRYTIDLAASGTLDHPLASGRVRLSGARYENFTTGAVLTDLNADLVGDRERLNLRSFSAGDGEGGRIEARGSILLAAGQARADLSAELHDFRVAAREEAVATASGKVRIEGPLAAPRVAADLVSGRAELRVPKELPPSVTRLNVTVIDSKTGTGPPAAKKPRPVLPATLDLKITLPGRVFVRGRGLDSEWRGRLLVDGTSAHPRLSGSLTVVRGNFAFLGKSFRVEHGTISFAGALQTNPILDVLATASASDVTAEVHIRGPLSAAKITLSSTPSLPQDEVLSRVLFNEGLGQITATQGLELAQTAAALTGKGPDMLDRLRGRFGLDWLRLGEAAAGGGVLNPAATAPSGTAGTALSGGKYIAEGISVGVTQGLSPPTSKLSVDVELRPHLSVETEFGNHGGSGVGLYYKYNY